MQTGKIDQELSNLWTKYQKILNNPNATWDDINEARAILFTTGNIYLEQIASEAIEKRLKHLKEKFTILEFLSIIDSNSPKLERLRECPKFKELETFYLIIKKHKNKYSKGKFYLDEEQFIEKIRNYGGTPEVVFQEQQLMDIFLPILRADFSLNDSHTYRPEKLFNCPITAFYSPNDKIAEKAYVEEWEKQTTSKFDLHMIEGGHFFINEHKERILKIISTDIKDIELKKE